MSETFPCPLCDAHIGASAKKCRHCGEWVARSCRGCGTPVRGEWAARGLCAECEAPARVPATSERVGALRNPRSRTVAAVTAFFLGGVGAHRFYVGNPLSGVVYLVFAWTFIPSLLGMFEGIRYALMSDDEFRARYSG